MKVLYSMTIDFSLSKIFDEEIKKFSMKRSTALTILMNHFNSEISGDFEKTKSFVLMPVLSVPGYGSKNKSVSLSVDEDVCFQFFKVLGSMKQKQALEKLITYFLNLSNDEKYKVLFG